MSAADIIISNASVLTMDDAAPHADAVAVTGNTITAVGSRSEIEALQAKHTRLIDARGGTVTPGMIEGHVHIFMGGAQLDFLDIAGVQGREQLAAKVRPYAAAHPNLRLIFANKAAYTIFDDRVLPTRQDLDRVLPDRPLAIICYDIHTVFANTRALEAAGILTGAATPPGSKIVMGADGLATGELREPGAFGSILALTPTAGRDALGYTMAEEPSPAPTAAERAIDRGIILSAQKYCAAYGITSVHNMDGNFYQLELLQEIDGAGECHVRCQSPYHFKNTFALARLAEADAMRRQFRSERVSSGRVKLFMDGVMESWTALTLEEYPDKPGCYGDPNFTAAQFNELAIAVDKMGLQINVHAIADGAVRRTLDGLQAAVIANGRRDSRHRIEHLETVHPSDFVRLRDLGVIASVQPTHAPGIIFPLEPATSRIRNRDLPNAYAWQSLREAGAAMMFNSDWPVAPLSPMLSIMAAMTRKPFRSGDREQNQTLMQALKGYTTGAAYGEFMEHRKGMLRPGMLADIAVFGADLEQLLPEQLPAVKTIATICDGRVTHMA